jgi:RecB family exonuclease
MTDLVLSVSALNAYLTCGYRYLLAYVHRLPGEQSVQAAMGQAVHAGAEAYWQSPLRPEAVAEQEWTTSILGVSEADLAEDPAAWPDAELMLRAYITKAAPGFRPTLIEAPFQMETEGVVLTGVIDAADERVDEIRDLKSTRGKTINGRKPRFDPQNYRLQMSIYALGYKHLTGRQAQRLILDVVNRRGAYRQYEIQADYGEVKDVIGLVRDGIIRGEYEPTGALSGACMFCPYMRVCRYATVP